MYVLSRDYIDETLKSFSEHPEAYEAFLENGNVVSAASYYHLINEVKGVFAAHTASGYTAVVFAIKRAMRLSESYVRTTGKKLYEVISENICAKLGKDEYFSLYGEYGFVAFLKGSADGSEKRMREYLKEASELIANDPSHMKIGFVCGIYPISEEDSDVEEVIKKACSAMNSADSTSGVTSIVLYNEEIYSADKRRLIIESDLRNAVYKNELIIEIQPKYDMKTGQCVSAEALVRWMHPQLGRIAPDEFIGFAEQTGDIVDIDMYVLRTVCRHMRRWMDMGVNPVPIAVNQSRLHITEPDYVERVFAMMQEYDVWPSLIELETTESIDFIEYDSVKNILKRLHDYGFVLSMDDFGSGYSSIYMLNELHYDVLKLDQTIIQYGSNSVRTAALLRHVIAMAHDLDMIVVAEGIETEEQAELLRNLGCDLAQGFLYAYPMTIDKFDATVFGIMTP